MGFEGICADYCACLTAVSKERLEGLFHTIGEGMRGDEKGGGRTEDYEKWEIETTVGEKPS